MHQAAARAEPMLCGMCTVRCAHSHAPLRMVQCKAAGHAQCHGDHAPHKVGWAMTARNTTCTCMHALPPTLKAPCTMTPRQALTLPLVYHNVKVLLLIDTAACPNTAPPTVYHTKNTTIHCPMMDHVMCCIPSSVPAPLTWCPPHQ